MVLPMLMLMIRLMYMVASLDDAVHDAETVNSRDRQAAPSLIDRMTATCELFVKSRQTGGMQQ